MNETVRHIKRGTTYDVIGEAELQASKYIVEGQRLTVYRCHGDGKLWARPTSEFRDGRFEPLPASPSPVLRDALFDISQNAERGGANWAASRAATALAEDHASRPVSERDGEKA